MTEFISKSSEDEKRWISLLTARAEDEAIYLDDGRVLSYAHDLFHKAQRERSFFMYPHHKEYVVVSSKAETWGKIPDTSKNSFSQAVKAAFEQLQKPVCDLLLDTTEEPLEWPAFFVGHDPTPLVDQLEETRRRHDFEAHAQKWHEDTMYVSSAIEMVLHPSYQRIIGMGPAVLPLLFRDLEQKGRDWFWALSSITGENPVGPDDAGNVPKMRTAWVNWGRQHGYI